MEEKEKEWYFDLQVTEKELSFLINTVMYRMTDGVFERELEQSAKMYLKLIDLRRMKEEGGKKE